MDAGNIPKHNKGCLWQAYSQKQIKWREMQSN